MNVIEAEGSTIEEAIANALKQLQVERDRVEIEILSHATKGFLGIGGKKARVRAAIRAPLSVRTAEPQPEPQRPRPRNRQAESPRPTEGEPQLYRQRERPREVEPAKEVTKSEESIPPSPELGEKACAAIKELLQHMQVSGTPTVGVRDGEMIITVTGAPEGFLIGHRGQTLDALEYLLNRITTHSEESEGHIAVDVDGYRERRWKSLEHLALRLGERAKRRRKTITLSPLSPRDRRVIHLTLEEDPLVSTKSVGRGYFRQVCIVPEEGSRQDKGKGAGRLQAAES
jgi:spoIIIJ-associated protein